MGSTAQSLRWRMTTFTPETGNNNGSHFAILNYDDNGNPIGGATPSFSINRKNSWVFMKSATIYDSLYISNIIATNKIYAPSIEVDGSANFQSANVSMNVNNFSASTTMSFKSYCAILTGTSTNQTITLPPSPSIGRLVTIVNHSSQFWIISPGFTSVTGNATVLNSGFTLQLIYDGTVWRKMN